MHLLLSIFYLGAVLAGFVLPGFGLASWLHRRDGFHWTLRCALGFAWSSALFGALGWPFLWYGKTLSSFLSILYPAWAAFALLGLAAYVRARRSRSEPSQSAPVAAIDPTPRGELARPTGRRAATFVALFVAVLVGLAIAWALRSPGVFFLVAVPAALTGVALLARRLRRAIGHLVPFQPQDHEAPPRAWVVAAVVAIGLQAVAATVYDRPDWDDCMYLAAAGDYQHAGRLNQEEPTHREGIPMPAAHRTMCWELWGSVVCRLTGLSPMALFHSFLPGFLVLLAYAGYAGLLGQWLPRRWVPLALVGLCGVHLWGISSHEAVANFLLPRMWQGKSVLAHMAIPLYTLLVARFVEQPDWRRWVSMFCAVGFGLAASLSAIFLILPLAICLTAAQLWALPRRNPRSAILILGAVASTLLPLAIAAVGIRGAIRRDLAFGGTQVFMGSWWPAIRDRLGSAELMWLLSLPLIGVVLGDRRRRAYYLAFPILLGLTFANPLAFRLVAAKMTSFYTYPRLWWLLPVAPGLAVFWVLLARLAVRVWPPQRRRLAAPLAWTAASALFLLALPGVYVFGETNSFIGALGRPRVAENLEKMPAGLLAVARELTQDGEARNVRILCNEQVASFLTPYSRDLRFVETRPLYTPVLFAAAGRGLEGLERHLLASYLLNGRIVPSRPQFADWARLRTIYGEPWMRNVYGRGSDDVRNLLTRDTATLLKRYRVKYAVTGPGDSAAGLRQSGFRVRTERCGIALWELGGAGSPDGPSRANAGAPCDEGELGPATRVVVDDDIPHGMAIGPLEVGRRFAFRLPPEPGPGPGPRYDGLVLLVATSFSRPWVRLRVCSEGDCVDIQRFVHDDETLGLRFKSPAGGGTRVTVEVRRVWFGSLAFWGDATRPWSAGFVDGGATRGRRGLSVWARMRRWLGAFEPDWLWSALLLWGLPVGGIAAFVALGERRNREPAA